MAVTLDVIADRPRVRDTNGRIVELSRYADVDSLTAGSNMLRSSLRQSGLPEPGDKHPDEATLYLEDRIPTQRTQTSARVELIYRFREQVEEEGLINRVSDRTISGGSSITLEPTEIGTDGAQLTVNDSTGRPQPADAVSIYFPTERLTIEYTEPHPFPRDVAKEWTRKLNSTPWLDEPEDSWLCASVDYRLIDDYVQPKNWSWTFEFLYRPHIFTEQFGVISGWSTVVVGYDVDTGTRIANPNADAGEIRQGIFYASIDFNTKFTK